MRIDQKSHEYYKSNFLVMFNNVIEPYVVEADSSVGYIVKYILDKEGDIVYPFKYTKKIYGHVRFINVQTCRDPESDYVFNFEKYKKERGLKK